MEIGSLLKKCIVPATSILLSFAIGAIAIFLGGFNPIETYRALILGTLGSVGGISEVLVKTIPLTLTGLAAAIAFRCRIWNIGAEGQLISGAIFGTWAALSLPEIPIVSLLVVLLMGFIGGSIWSAVPAALKTKFGINEIVVTVMLNFTAILTLNYVVRGPLLDPHAIVGYSYPQSAKIPEFEQLPILLLGTRLHAGLIVAILCVAVIYLIMMKTPLGYKFRTIGMNPQAARYGGIDVTKNMLIVFLLSGGLAGVAGVMEIIGVNLRLLDGISSNYGYLGVVVALLGGLHPVGVFLAALFLGFLIFGIQSAQRSVGLPVAFVIAFEGIVIICLLLGEYIQQHFERLRGSESHGQ